FFFFQAEDGIRDGHVTGVQTCALPICCQICVEVCPFEAIKMDTEFELSNTDRFGGLLLDKHQLAKSNEYYQKIHPTEAAEVDSRSEERRVGKECRGEWGVVC